MGEVDNAATPELTRLRIYRDGQCNHPIAEGQRRASRRWIGGIGVPSKLGTNSEATRYAGINNARTLLGVYLLSSFFASIAGIIMMARFNSAKADYGQSYLLVTVLAAVLGGTSASGGGTNSRVIRRCASRRVFATCGTVATVFFLKKNKATRVAQRGAECQKKSGITSLRSAFGTYSVFFWHSAPR